MILNEQEVKTCLEFALTPFLRKYEIIIKEASLKINETILLRAVIIYQSNILDLKVSFKIDYQHHQLCFQNIKGQVEYLFLKLNIMNVLKQLLVNEHIHIEDQQCLYDCDLPIQSIQIVDQGLDIQLKS